jgi:hypothetical protein
MSCSTNEELRMSPTAKDRRSTKTAESPGKPKVAGIPLAPGGDSQTTLQRVAFDLPRELAYRMRQRVNARKYRSGNAKIHTLASLAEECIRTYLDALEKREGPV